MGSPPARLISAEILPSSSKARIGNLVAAQLTRGLTPEKIALSLAVGSLCAFFPILGAATPLCLIAGIALRLNQPVIQTVNGATSFAYVPLVLVFIRLGDFLLGAPHVNLDPRLMAPLLWNNPAQFFRHFGPTVGHALLGWAVLSPLWIVTVYHGSLRILRAIAMGMPRNNRQVLIPSERPENIDSPCR
jgi:uncharacterized protein (DUF2062 family)